MLRHRHQTLLIVPGPIRPSLFSAIEDWRLRRQTAMIRGPQRRAFNPGPQFMGNSPDANALVICTPAGNRFHYASDLPRVHGRAHASGGPFLPQARRDPRRLRAHHAAAVGEGSHPSASRPASQCRPQRSNALITSTAVADSASWLRMHSRNWKSASYHAARAIGGFLSRGPGHLGFGGRLLSTCPQG